MNEIINMLSELGSLGIAIIINIALGMFYNIRIKDIKFDKYKLIEGIVKAAIIAGSFIGLAYCFEVSDLSSIGITPKLVMNTAIILYVGKDLTALGKILGVETNSSAA